MREPPRPVRTRFVLLILLTPWLLNTLLLWLLRP